MERKSREKKVPPYSHSASNNIGDKTLFMMYISQLLSHKLWMTGLTRNGKLKGVDH